MAYVAERDAERAADERQQQPFDQQLPHDAAAAAAEREPDRELLAAGAAAREQHRRQVQAHRQQHRAASSRAARRRASCMTLSFDGDVLVPNFGSAATDSTWCSYSAGKRLRQASTEAARPLRRPRRSTAVLQARDQEQVVRVGALSVRAVSP